MASKTLTLAALVEAQREKGKRARARRVEKRQTQSPVKWLGKEWMSLIKKDFPELEVEWTGADVALVKRLVDERGFDGVLELFTHFFMTWDRRKASRTGTPGVKLLWAMRGQLDAEIAGHAKVPELRETRIKSGEYTEEAAAANPSQGWGDISAKIGESYEGGGNGW